MKRLVVLTVLFVLGLLAAPSQEATAQAETASSPANLVGVWNAITHEAEGSQGYRWEHDRVTHRMTITNQTGSIVNGTWFYKSEAGPGHDGEKPVREREFSIVGVISWSGDEITLVNHTERDTVVFTGRIVNPHTIEMIAYEAGERGWVGKYLMVRR